MTHLKRTVPAETHTKGPVPEGGSPHPPADVRAEATLTGFVYSVPLVPGVPGVRGR